MLIFSLLCLFMEKNISNNNNNKNNKQYILNKKKHFLGRVWLLIIVNDITSKTNILENNYMTY